MGVGRDTVVVGTHDDALSTQGETVIGLAADDGTERWTAESGDVRGGTVAGETAIAEDVRNLRAFDIPTGEPQWTFETADYGGFGPVVFGTTVLVGDETVHGLGVSDGRERWRFGASSEIVTLSRAGATAYVGGAVVAALKRDGTTRWTDAEGGTFREVVKQDDTLFVANGEGIRALSDRDGSERWRVSISADHAMPAAVAGDRILLFTGDAGLLARETGDGAAAWSWRSRQGLLLPAADDSLVYVPGREGGLWALSP